MRSHCKAVILWVWEFSQQAKKCLCTYRGTACQYYQKYFVNVLAISGCASFESNAPFLFNNYFSFFAADRRTDFIWKRIEKEGDENRKEIYPFN